MARRRDAVDRIVPISSWSDHPAADYPFVALILAIHLGLSRGWPAVRLPIAIDPAHRDAFFATTATVVAVVFGFCTAAITSYLGAHGERMTLIRRQVGHVLARNWHAMLWAQLVAAGASLLMIAFGNSRGAADLLLRWFAELALALAVARCVRLLWLFSFMLEVTAAEDADDELAPAPRLLDE